MAIFITSGILSNNLSILQQMNSLSLITLSNKHYNLRCSFAIIDPNAGPKALVNRGHIVNPSIYVENVQEVAGCTSHSAIGKCTIDISFTDESKRL
uniref:Uncharacterized protein n=1 Tax=Neogobius melanostomus TaxID=47308 RepID=A0A8C6TGY0_9GOBI